MSGRAFWITAVAAVFAAGIAGGHYGPAWWHRIHAAPKEPPPSQSITYYDVDPYEDGGFVHFVGLRQVVHRAGLGEDYSNYVTLTLDVAPDGRVISATPYEGPKHFYPDAVALAQSWKLKPFLRNGQPIHARIKNVGIWFVPPERWRDYPVPFPPIRDFSSVAISLTRTACFGSCPAYHVTVHGEGSVEFEGLGFVAVQGKHRAKVSVAVVRHLVDAFRNAKFFSLLPDYTAQVTDNPRQIVSISFDGRSAQVTDYVGRMVGMPDAATDLEVEIDRALGVDRWVTGNDDTVPSLIAERWDFKADTCVATSLVAGLARRASENVVLSALNQGAPVSAKCRDGAYGGAPAALVSAAERQDRNLYDVLLAAGAGKYLDDVRNATIEAAAKGNLEMVLGLSSYLHDDYDFSDALGRTVLIAAAESCAPMLVLNLGIGTKVDVNAVDKEGKTALHHAASSYTAKARNPKADCAETVRQLIASGAKVDARERWSGDTPLIANAFDPAIARHLIKAGADVNARNKSGQTALMNSWDRDLTRVLLKAGANPWVTDDKGRTALQLAKEASRKESAAVLEAWMKAHPKK